MSTEELEALVAKQKLQIEELRQAVTDAPFLLFREDSALRSDKEVAWYVDALAAWIERARPLLQRTMD